MIRQAIVLAAGLSKRFGRVKQLINIRGRPLMWYPIAVLHSIGVDEFCLVARRETAISLARVVESIAGRSSVEIVVNTSPERENGYSLLIGLANCSLSTYTYVSMSDHVYSPFIAIRLAGMAPAYSYVIAGDKDPSFIDVDEATRIVSDGVRGYRVGKGIEYWTHIDSGVHAIQPHILSSIIADSVLLSAEILRLNDLTNYVARIGGLGVAGFESLPWAEVDTVNDVYELEEGRRREVVDHVLAWLRG